MQKLAAGLYLVATPIGNARDITLRALDVLRTADVLAAEDTRSLRRLMEIHGIGVDQRPVLAYHDHNGAKMRPRLLAAMEEGKSVAYATDAGTPMISDPGFDLARAAQTEGHAVTTAPGVSAAITALTLGGLPTDSFYFAGFLPNATGARKRALTDLRAIPATLVLYESPHRITAMLKDAADTLGPDRPAALCRELTKTFEEIRKGTLAELIPSTEQKKPKGELVVLIGKAAGTEVEATEITSRLTQALETMSVRDAADFVSEAYNLPRRPIYQEAMKIKSNR